jgi:hypothetical protein
VRKAYEYNKKVGRVNFFISVDIHDTIAESNYSDDMPMVIDCAIDALKKLNSFPEIVLILFSSSYNHSQYIEYFKKHGVFFKYFNENPEVCDTKTGDFSKKFFYNLLIDDKAGFDRSDWITVTSSVEEYRKIMFPPVTTNFPTELSDDEYGKYFNAYYFSTYDSVDSYDSELFLNKEYAESRRQAAIRESEVRAENYNMREKTLERVYAEIEASVPGHMIDSVYEAKIDSLEAEYPFMLDYDIEPTIVGELKIKKIYI